MFASLNKEDTLVRPQQCLLLLETEFMFSTRIDWSWALFLKYWTLR